MSKNAHLLDASPLDRVQNGQILNNERLSKFLAEIRSNLDEGFAAEAEARCFEIVENYSNSIDGQAQVNQLLSLTLAMQGRFEDALKALKPFEDEAVLGKLTAETRVSLLTRQALAYSNSGDASKSVTLLNTALEIAEERDFAYLLTNIYLAFARVYEELAEYPIARNYAEKTMKSARDLGDRRGLTEAYCTVAISYHREGNDQKSIENFQQALKICGDRPAPYLIGKIYSDMAAAYSALMRPQDGLDYAKKSITLFEKIGHQYELIIAYNNLGVNFLVSGDWTKSEEALNRALDSALETDHPYLAVILASLGEIEFLRGDNEEAEKIFSKAIGFAAEIKKDRYSIPVLYNLARCLLAQGEYEAAILQAQDAFERSQKTKQRNIANLANLILAEAYLKKRKTQLAEDILQNTEENESSANHLVLGGIARVRALMALAVQDDELTLHHFNRSLSIFEMAGDRYHSAMINYEIGRTFLEKQPHKAIKNLESAVETFRQLGALAYLKATEDILSRLNRKEVSLKREQAISSQLLMLRLVEAVASRELLFRELITILRQDGKARKTLLAELKEGRKFQPSIIDGFVPTESAELMTKLHEAQIRNDLDTFVKEKNLSIFHLRAPNALPALLVVSPASGASLTDSSSIRPLLQVVELGMEVCALRERSQDSRTVEDLSPFTNQNLMPGFIHTSPSMTELVDEVQKIRTSDITVLITGESGTGKELIARAVHFVSQRKDKVFVPFNCTAVPKELTEGHLFGYKRGAFTGAVADSEGMIRSADGGTLFLDEIGDLPLDVQPKILRFLQEGEVQPLGEKSPKKVDVRIIAATNMKLEEMVAQGLFREDLYYRLNVLRLRVPPLRDRRSEIPQMVDYYLDVYSAKFGRKDLSMTSEALDLLITYYWKGNVRQLCNEVQRIVARSDNGDKITPLHLSPELRPMDDSISATGATNVKTIGLTGGAINIQTDGVTIEAAVNALEIQMITDSLKRHKNNISRVAKELNLTRRGLYLKLERYKIK